MDLIIYDTSDNNYSYIESTNNISSYDSKTNSCFVKEDDALGIYEIGIIFYNQEDGSLAGEGWFVHSDKVNVKFYLEKIK